MFLAESALIAAAVAALGVFGEVAGCLIVAAIGVTALITSLRNQQTPAPILPQPSFRQFIPWGVCTLLYAVFVILLAPFASMPAVFIALLVLSPLCGTQVFLVSTAVDRLAMRDS